VTDDIKPSSVSYEHCGFEAVIELTWTLPGLVGPDYIVISIKHQGCQKHRMRLSSNYASVAEAIAAAEGLVRHYASVVGIKAR